MDTLKDYLESNEVYSVVKAFEVNSIPLGNILICKDYYPHFFSIEELERIKSLIETTLAAYEFAGWDEETIKGINERSCAALSPGWIREPVSPQKPLFSFEIFLYIIGNREKDTCKVGISDKPYKRIKALQTSCPFELEILEVYKAQVRDEKELHSILKEHNLHKHGEWFSNIDNVIKIADYYFGYGQGV